MPASVASVRIYLGIDPASTVDEQALDAAVAAANSWIAFYGHPLTVDANGDPTDPWDPRAEQAANTQAARWYGRRGSALGGVAYQDTGVMVLGRLDPDVRAMLGMGEFQDSVIA